MKIAILSLVLHTNYGGILQSYALQTVLERMGHEVTLLSTNHKRSLPPFYKLPWCYTKRLARKLLKDWNTSIFYEQKLNKEYPVLSQNIQRFIDEYLHVRMIRSFDDIKETDYDAFVVGSDQVWRALYFEKQWKQSIENAFLKFTKGWNVIRIAYAASFGEDSWKLNEVQTKRCGELLKQFDRVSVREESGVRLCKERWGVEAVHALDPTMLLTADDYRDLTKNEPTCEGDLLVYMLDENEEKQQLVSKIAQTKGLKPFRVIHSAAKTAPLEERVKPKVVTWLKGFQDAKFVVTDSFHACVFAILFEKPFVVVSNEGRGCSRFDSLLKQIGLETHIVSIHNYDASKAYSSHQNGLQLLKSNSIKVLQF